MNSLKTCYFVVYSSAVLLLQIYFNPDTIMKPFKIATKMSLCCYRTRKIKVSSLRC